jgi:hypothetical protein
VSPAESIARATAWLQDLVSELSGLRNATSRDPSFKNWRQNAITTLQRIWPADQEHAERFRRIPFSPVDPRADMRAQRESFSRGCQEAARVLASFVEEVHTLGVPAIIADQTPLTEESGFEDGFPTVDLPSGDLSHPDRMQAPQDPSAPDLPPQVADPSFTQPSAFRFDGAANAPASPTPSGSIPGEARPARKGLGVAAKLRDLLGLTGFAGKPAPTPQPSPSTSTTFQQPLPRSLDIVAVGDEVDSGPRSRAWSLPPAPANTPQPPQAPAAASPSATPPAEAGMSVVMSRPTTLRTSIEKVTIESLISPEFRGGAEGSSAPPAPSGPQAAERPPISIVPPLSSDPEFNVDPAPPATPSKVLPLPLPPIAPAAEAPADAVADGDDDSPEHKVDAAERARAAEDFMRTSPVLGATGRKVQRAAQESAEHPFTDPDAIAIASMVDELTLMGVPTTRQSETRARLMDLARRIERADLEWNALRKAVWFAMEYPEVARRLMPMLLPWIDRAA